MIQSLSLKPWEKELIREISERSRAEILPALILCVQISSSVIAGLLYFHNPIGDASWSDPSIRHSVLIANLVMWVAFGLAKTRYPSWGGALFLISAAAVVFTNVFHHPESGHLYGALIWLVPFTLICSLVFSLRVAVPYMIAVLAGFALLWPHVERSSRASFLILVIFYLTTSILAFAFAALRSRSEAEVRQSESKFRSVFNNAAVGIKVVGHDHRIQACNRALVEMLGYSETELRGRDFRELVHPEDMALVGETAASLRAGRRRPVQLELKMVRKDGGAIWIKVTVSVLRSPLDGETRTLSIVEDVTARKRAEEDLARQQSRTISASKMSALGEMAGGIAHEINNPLAIIHARAQQLQRMVNQDKLDPHYVLLAADAIERTSIRISKIVKSLRAFSRDASKDPLQRVTLGSIVEDTLEFCHERFRNREIRLHVQVPPDLELDCRPVEIAQVLLNLMNNAYDAVESLEHKTVELGARATEEGVEVWVADSGTGIPAGVRDRILQPFFTTKPMGKGTGLGLSVSVGIVESHGGRLWLDSSTPNTRFVIRMPRAEARI